MVYICELRNVSKRFHTINNETKAIDDISFKVKKGDSFYSGTFRLRKVNGFIAYSGLEKPSEGKLLLIPTVLVLCFKRPVI